MQNIDGVSVVQDLYDIRSQNKQILQVMIFLSLGGLDLVALLTGTGDILEKLVCLCGAEGLDAVSVPEPEKKPSSSAAAPKTNTRTSCW